HLELPTHRRCRGVEVSSHDPEVRAVMSIGGPDDEETAVAGAGHSWLEGTEDARIYAELLAHGCSARIEPLAEDPADGRIAGPDDQEVAVGAHRQRWRSLASRRVRVHQELGSQRLARGV